MKAKDKFEALKEEYKKEYLRTNGKEVISLKYERGFVYVNLMPVRVSKFEEMLNTLKQRPDHELAPK